jgi:hypothetical protein
VGKTERGGRWRAESRQHDLYPAQDVPAAGIFGRAWDTMRLWFH